MSEPQTIAEAFARDFGREHRYFAVTEQIVRERRDWSDPVQFRFVDGEDGQVQMILRTVDLRSIVED